MNTSAVRHCYYGTGVDTQVVHEQALKRMTDTRSPESSVIHHHPADGTCGSRRHTFFSARTQQVVPYDEGTISDEHVWATDDDNVRQPKPPMASRWETV